MTGATPVILGDRPLCLEEIVEVARAFRPVELGPTARKRAELSAEIVRFLLEKGVKVYGLTTGFASMRDKAIAPRDAAKLSQNLIRSHAAGVGAALPEDVVRAAMLLRAQALAQGNSGIRATVIDCLIAFLNGGLYPYVPEHGSVGCSGDLAPLSHVALALIGDPLARVHRNVHELRGRQPVTECGPSDFVELDPSVRDAIRDRLADARVWPVELQAKEGLALNNGAVVTTAVTALALHDAGRLLDAAELTLALSCEAHQAVPDFIAPGVVALRPHTGHIQCADRLRHALSGSELVGAEAPTGLNMAFFNGAIVELHRAGSACTSEAEKAEIERLRSSLVELQKDVWGRIAQERDRVLAEPVTETATLHRKSLELRACASVFEKHPRAAPVLPEWRRLIGWSNEPAALAPGGMREYATGIYARTGARIVRDIGDPEIQDNYSFRSAPTVLGACREVLLSARRVVEVEANSATDNPLILLDQVLGAAGLTVDSEPDALRTWLGGDLDQVSGFGPAGPAAGLSNWAVAADAVKSASNFHGEPIGLVADQLAVAMAEVGAIAERRIAVLTDAHFSKGLPSFLVWSPGIDSGLMMAQYTAASIVGENRSLASPCSVDSVPTGEGCEDHVAMSLVAARQCARVVQNSEQLVALELLTAYQGVQFRKPARLGLLTGKLEATVEAVLVPVFARSMSCPEADVAPRLRKRLAEIGLGPAACAAVRACIVEDVVLYPFVEAVLELVRSEELAAITRSS